MGQGIKDRLKRYRWQGLLALTLVPVSLAVLLLQLLGPVGAPVSALELGLLKGALSREPFLAGILSLVAVLSVHLCICLCGLALARSMLARTDEDRSFFWFGIAVGAAVGAVVVLLSFWTQADGRHALTVYRLTYDFFHDLYAGSGAGQSLLRPRLLGVDALGWAILIPTLLGIVGVGALTAAAGAELRHLPEPPPLPNELYEVQLETAQGRLKRSLYVLTLGLVASTIAVSLFFHLPAKLSQNGFRGGAPALAWQVGAMTDAQIAAATARAELVAKAEAVQDGEMKAIRAKLDDFAGELTVYWGAVFTLTLLAAGAVPLLLLERRVRRYAENSADAAAVAAAEDRLGHAGLLSGGLDQVKLVAAVIAPLASGQIATLVQVATGGG
jgi:hypothetical protein